MKSNTAKIFREMQSADEIRAEMKQSIMGRAQAQLGNAYEKGQNAVRESGLIGALNDIYRRVFENGWFQKDIFDGRWQADTQQLGTSYDQRAAFYGLDQKQQDNSQDRDRGDELGR